MITSKSTDAVIEAIPSFKLMSDRKINPERYFTNNFKSSKCFGSVIPSFSVAIDNGLNSFSKTLLKGKKIVDLKK